MININNNDNNNYNNNVLFLLMLSLLMLLFFVYQYYYPLLCVCVCVLYPLYLNIASGILNRKNMNVCRHVATERSAAVHVYRLSGACIAVCVEVIAGGA